MDDNKLKIEIYDHIGKVFDWETWSYKGVNFEDVKNLINEFDGEHIDVYINSEGGQVLVAEGIYSLLKGHSATVHTHIVGYAISAATIISMAGDVVHMSDNAYFMIHNPMSGQYGDVNDMQQMTNTLEVFTKKLASDYSKKTGLDTSVIRQLMDAETWMPATEAKEKGFVDVLTEGVNIAASLYNQNTFQNYKNLPTGIVNQFFNNNNSNNMNAFEQLKANMNEGFTAIQNSIKSITASNEKDEAVELKGIDALTTSIANLQESFVAELGKVDADIQATVTELVADQLKDLDIENLKKINVENFVTKDDLPKDNTEVLKTVSNQITEISKTLGEVVNQDGSFKAEGLKSDPPKVEVEDEPKDGRPSNKTKY